MGAAAVVDSDQHIYEPRTMWADHIDPAKADDALGIVDDELGYAWVTWRGRRLGIADVHFPGKTDSNGEHRRRYARGEPAMYRYDDALPDDYWKPAARVRWLDSTGLDATVCFPNFGLLWERRLSSSLPALTANMGAWNRWCAVIAEEGKGRLHPVGHLTLRDPEWLKGQLDELSAAGISLAMVAPAPVDGRALSDPAHDRLWAAFVDHGITPVFHVADQPRVFDDCWYPDQESGIPAVESVFLWVPAALAITDLIVNAVFERFPDLSVGVVELSSIWVPQYLLMLDGGIEFTSKLNGGQRVALSMKPSEYFRRQVRVASFSYERPDRLTTRTGDLFMCCSDYPHSEGTATPLVDYEAVGCVPESHPGLFGGNVGQLLGVGGSPGAGRR
jgi:hypothetical protein